MMNKGVAIQYGDVAPEAKENFVPTASESQFGNKYKSELQKYNLVFENYANPCELYQTVLDGTASAFPSVPENANLGLWSEQISNDDGTFQTPIVLELNSDGQYTSQGLTLTFDVQNNIHAKELKIEWYRVADGQAEQLDSETFYPTSATYFCRKYVQNYNRIVITFYSLNMPKNRLKLRVIDYGYGTVFLGSELRNTKLIQEIDTISTQIFINTADFTVDSKTDMEYSFQAKQPLSIYFNGQLKATTFVKTSKRKAKFLWEIQSEDYIGIMDGVTFYGGMYNGKDAYELLEEIFNSANVPYAINENLKGVLLYGYIPFTTCRDALMQVSFAVQNVVSTSNSDVVNVFELESDTSKTVPLNRIMQGQNFVNDEIVTAVEVVAHNYKAITETIEVYNASESGTGENIFVTFSEPLHDLSITNGTFALDKAGNELKHTNYAVINANEGCVLSGQKYEHTTQTKRRNRIDVGALTSEKVMAIENATLVSVYNVNMILDSCFDWLTKTDTTNLKIIESKHVQYGDYIKYGERKYGTFKYSEKTPNIVTYDERVNLGDNINAETEYLGTVSGRLIKQSFNLNGNSIVKDAVLK
jgi:hypothetical protein